MKSDGGLYDTPIVTFNAESRMQMIIHAGRCCVI